jgi:hypothetical protein
MAVVTKFAQKIIMITVTIGDFKLVVVTTKTNSSSYLGV